MIEALKLRLGDGLLSHEVLSGDDVLTVGAEGIHAALQMLRDEPEFAFDLLSDLFGMDRGVGAEGRFVVVYNLTSLSHRRRLRLQVRLPESDPEVESASDLWPAACWMEREAFDLFGIRFRNHPDLRRILLPDGYDGHPLRKDYPMQGHGERDAFMKYTTQTPLGDLLKTEEFKERLA